MQRELVATAALRAHANETFDFEAYAHLSEQESDLLAELATLPAPRQPAG